MEKNENEKSYSVKMRLPSKLMLLFSIRKSSLSFKRLDDTKSPWRKKWTCLTKTPPVNPYIYGQRLLDKDAKTIQWGEEVSLTNGAWITG